MPAFPLAAQGVMAGAALHAILAAPVSPRWRGGRQERRGSGLLMRDIYPQFARITSNCLALSAAYEFRTRVSNACCMSVVMAVEAQRQDTLERRYFG
jgi:hypothetical protein